MSTVSPNLNRAPPVRTACTGWSKDAAIRNRAWLRSIDERHVFRTTDGEVLVGYTLTLTVRDCPPTAADWHAVRRAYLHRLRRLGMVRLHWVVEWQRRGVPHLHGVAFFPESGRGAVDADQLADHWCAAAAAYGPRPAAQCVRSVTDMVGWGKYLAKHGARGVAHYQRSADSVPSGWAAGTGRVWGHGAVPGIGDWPIQAPEVHTWANDDATWWRLRRLYRGWARAQARREVKDIERRTIAWSLSGRTVTPKIAASYTHRHKLLQRANGLLRCPHAKFSAVRGPSLDIPIAVSRQLLEWVAAPSGTAVAATHCAVQSPIPAQATGGVRSAGVPTESGLTRQTPPGSAPTAASPDAPSCQPEQLPLFAPAQQPSPARQTVPDGRSPSRRRGGRPERGTS